MKFHHRKVYSYVFVVLILANGIGRATVASVVMFDCLCVLTCVVYDAPAIKHLLPSCCLSESEIFCAMYTCSETTTFNLC